MPETTPAVFTPTQVAHRLAVNKSKVLAWIRSGQLRALNVAAQAGPGRRPRFRIQAADLAAFEAARQSGPAATDPAAATPRPETRRGRRAGRPGTGQQFISPD